MAGGNKRAVNEPEPRPIIVKKIIVDGHGGHHGGAWKVAYADFVTAMMAFFLLMWLLGATTEQQRKGLADYFTPTLVELKEGSAGSNGLLGGDSMEGKENYPTSGGQGNLAITIPKDTGNPDKSKERAKAREKDSTQFKNVKAQIEAKLASNPAMRKFAKNIRFTETREGLRIETEPTWATLRQDMLSRINLQFLLGSVLMSVSSIAVSVTVVLLYALFLLVEQHHFAGKLAHLSDDPQKVARIGAVIGDINRRIGAYLAYKTLLSVLLAAISWIIMAGFGLEFAGFWAVLIAFLNFIPYLGSVLGVLFPAIMAVVQFSDPATLLALLVALTVAQFLIGMGISMKNIRAVGPRPLLQGVILWLTILICSLVLMLHYGTIAG